MSSRSGAALVIAIVVLAAMLLIGLPFLFTQSGSLSGTRSYAHSRLASMGQDSAQSMGVAAGASAASYHWQQDGVTHGTTLYLDDWTDLFHDLNGSAPNSGLRRVGVNRIEVDTRNHVFALPGENYLQSPSLPAADRDALLQRYPTVVGLSIEDESGKLDPNFIDMRGWSRLLQQVGITDLPDGRTPTSDPAHQQLARTLGTLRYEFPGGRITSIDQLLFAEPPLTIPGTTAVVSKQRRSLTRAELERLRPYLTLSVPAQARGGLIDLGTVIGVDGARITLDHDQPGAALAFAETPVLTGFTTALVFSDDSSGTLTIPAFGETLRLPQVGAAAAIDAPPVLNLHQAEPVVRNSFAPSPLPPAQAPAPSTNQPQPALLTGLHALPPLADDEQNRPRSPFDLVSPLAVIDTVASTHVLASRQTDTTYGVNGPFDATGVYKVDPADSTTMLLDARATIIHIVTGSLERFPQRGYALIKGIDATGQPAEEIIEYTSSSLTLPLSAEAAALEPEVTLYVRRGLNGVTGVANGSAKTFRSGTRPGRGFYDQPNDLHLSALAIREQQPLGIASQGVITIASTSTVTDPAGNQTAQEQHRVVAQALPQESALEARWDKQVAFHALLAQRQGSLLASFPQPISRLDGVLPQDAPNVSATNTRYVPPTNRADPDGSVGVRPALMRTLLTRPELNREWKLGFAGDNTQALNVTLTENNVVSGVIPGSGPYVVNDIRPEGLTLDRNRVLAYPNPSNGFITDAYNAQSRQLAPIQGRQFALWVRPDADWTREVMLLDMRMPAVNVSERLTGDLLPDQPRDARSTNPGDAAISNRFSLIYDPAVEQLVLILNPGTIPHAADYGPAIPRQTYGPTTGIAIKDYVWPAVNPECLGSGGLNQMASTPPEVVIQHRYHVGDRFNAGEWHLVQVAFSSNQPGGMSIIVDGLVGRDVTRTPTDPTAMNIPGDHLAQPVLVLATDLPTTQQVRDVGTKALYVERIALQALAYDTGRLTGAAAVRRLLPERGLVRIGREYISYQSIDDDGALLDCVRGRRQRTDGGVDDDGVPHWNSSHVMERHRIGDAVYPGGFAFTIQANVTWHRGGCHLAQPMPDGDPLHKFQVWSKVGVAILQANSTAIPLTSGVIEQFPPRGLVLIGPANGDDLKKEVYYDNGETPPSVSSPKLSNVHYFSSVPVPILDGDGKPVLDANMMPKVYPAGWIPALPSAYTSADEVVLVSQEIAGKNRMGEDLDPTQAALYPRSGFIQLYDARAANAGANAGRVEWISYTDIRSRTDYPTTPNQRVSYLINYSQETVDTTDPLNHLKKARGGFWFADGRTTPGIRFGARACHRTGFAAADFSDYTPAKYTFPALTTRVIPVLTNLEIAYLLEAGDVVTLAPQVMSSSQRPIQMCVRYSADDGFPEDKNDPNATSWNSMNRYFAFTEAIPDDWNPGNAFQLLSWPCWTPEDDLSQLNTGSAWSTSRLGWVLPWGNAYAPNFTPTAPDLRSITFLSTGVIPNPSVDATLDAVHAGQQPGWKQGTQVQANIVPLNDAVWLNDQPLSGRLAIRTDQSLFTVAYGLVEIGGEVFAYKSNSQADKADSERADGDPLKDSVPDNQAWLIGRSLLGSTPRAHQGKELVLHLPIGPVAEVIGGVNPVPAGPLLPLGNTYVGRVQLEGSCAAPAMLLTSRNGDRMELTTMPNSHTAPWLRGMYNTTPVAWAARPDAYTFDNLAPLAIGWWPRYPSAMPHDLHPQNDYFSERMRCRSYSWAGFPLRFHDSQFAANANATAAVTVLSNGDGLFDIKASALDATLDWSDARWMTLLLARDTPSSTPLDASEAFNSTRFITAGDEAINTRLTRPRDTLRNVDGAELRVVWTYSAPVTPSTTAPADWLQTAARNGNSAPMIGPVYLRTRAPNKVLNVER